MSPLKDRLYVKQAMIAVLVAFMLGIGSSLFKLVLDYRSEVSRAEGTVEQILKAMEEPASQAAYSLNELLAENVARGLFQYDPLYLVEITDEFGNSIARAERPRPSENRHGLFFLLDEDVSEFRLPLHLDSGTQIGIMRVRMDKAFAIEEFLDRALLTIVSGFIHNFALVILLSIVFYLALTKPVLRIVKDLADINPSRPSDRRIEIPKGHEHNELGNLVTQVNGLIDGVSETLEIQRETENVLRLREKTIQSMNAELENHVVARTEELEAANREMEAFSYSVSHDLRAPLRSVSGFVTMLEESLQQEKFDKTKVYMGNIRAGMDKMEMLVSDLLKLSRTTKGELQAVTFNLTNLCHEVLKELLARYPDRTVMSDIQPGMIVFADRRFMKILMENLIDNALKYAVEGRDTHIEIGSEQDAQSTIFFVKDNGCGFDMAHAGKLFSPFQRLHSSSSYEGSGIGLATVQRVARRHSGAVWARSGADGGATFYFTIGFDIGLPADGMLPPPQA